MVINSYRDELHAMAVGHLQQHYDCYDNIQWQSTIWMNPNGVDAENNSQHILYINHAGNVNMQLAFVSLLNQELTIHQPQMVAELQAMTLEEKQSFLADLISVEE